MLLTELKERKFLVFEDNKFELVKSLGRRRGCLVHYKMCNRTHDLCPLDANSVPLNLTTKMSPNIAKGPLRKGYKVTPS